MILRYILDLFSSIPIAIPIITIDIIGDDILNNRELVIYNILGEHIYTTETVANTSINLDVSSWKPGVYSIVVKMKDNNLRYRFIVE